MSSLFNQSLVVVNVGSDLLDFPEYPTACYGGEWARSLVVLQNPNPKGKIP